MTDLEQAKYEAELRRLKPGRLPADFLDRLRASGLATPAAVAKTAVPRAPSPNFHQLLRWLIPATAAVLVTAVIWQARQSSSGAGSKTKPHFTTTTLPALQADSIEMTKELVSSFDAVATLPGGEPVRFRCQQWRDKVVVDDKKQGLLVENWTPRVVVVPVGFETY